MSKEALEGIRVLDLSRILAGPTAAQMLGDFGAEVIKVERPGVGDDARRLGGASLNGLDGTPLGLAPMYVSSNRNKKSLTLDLSHPEGQALARDLACWADVLIENYKTGDLARYGLDYASLSVINPRLVYCSVTGFGQSGPYAARAGFDAVFQAMGGLMSVSGHRDGQPGDGPLRVGVPISDFIGGVHAYGAILTALYCRDRVTGRGQHVDLALLDTTIAAVAIAAADYASSGKVPPRAGNGALWAVPTEPFPCKDGLVQLSAPSDAMFVRVCRALERPDLAADPRFSVNAQRVKHRSELIELMRGLTRQLTRAELVARLEAAGAPGAPINDISEVMVDPHVVQREDFCDVPHPAAGSIRFGTSPLRLSDTPAVRRAPPPLLGEHSDWVLENVLKLDAARIADLKERKVV